MRFAFVALAVFAALRLEPGPKSVMLSIISDEKGHPGEVWMQPMISPMLDFQQTKGAAAPIGPIACTTHNEARTIDPQHSFLIIVIDCEGGRSYELVSVDLGAR